MCDKFHNKSIPSSVEVQIITFQKLQTFVKKSKSEISISVN